MTTEAAEADVPGGEKEPVAYRGSVIIEWPSAGSRPPQGVGTLLPGWGCAIFNAETGKPVTTATRIAVHADVRDFVTCDLTMFADPDGNPLLELERRWNHPTMPGPLGAGEVVWPDDEGNIRTATFPFLVAEMRVRA